MESNSSQHQKEPDTEKKILTAAGKVFMIKGKAGTSMQDIADEAGINRTLLHYYFRNKDKLFDAIFDDVLKKIFPIVAKVFMDKNPLFEKIESFCILYIDMLKDKPFLPFFLFQEIYINPKRLVGMIKEGGLDTFVGRESMKKELHQHGVDDMDPRHLIANLIGMVIFPFVGRPMFQKLAFNDDQEAYEIFLEQRKKEVPEFIKCALKGRNISST